MPTSTMCFLAFMRRLKAGVKPARLTTTAWPWARGKTVPSFSSIQTGFRRSRSGQDRSRWALTTLAFVRFLNLANPAAKDYLQYILEAMVKQYGLDLYRNDFNSPLKGEGLTTVRDGFVEAEYWPQYDALHEVYDHVHQEFPDLILQQASAGGTRMDLGTVARFSENYTSDRVTMPFVYRMLAGYTVYLPPETLVTPIGLAKASELPDMDTMLRSIYALGNTPFIFNSLIPKSVEEITPEIRAKFLHYTTLYKEMIRPMLPTMRVYHHAPVNADGGVNSGDWFAMEFGSPDHRQGWATLVRLDKDAPEDYLLKPSGLNPNVNYQVTFDSTGVKESMSGSQLAQQGLRIKPTNGTISELVIFRAEGGNEK